MTRDRHYDHPSHYVSPQPGIEPGLTACEASVLPTTPPGGMNQHLWQPADYESNLLTTQPLRHLHSNQASWITSRERKKFLCTMCTGDHKLWNCIKFKAKTPRERLAFGDHKKLCHNCFYGNHKTVGCRRTSRSIQGCGGNIENFSMLKIFHSKLPRKHLTPAKDGAVYMTVLGVSMRAKHICTSGQWQQCHILF